MSYYYETPAGLAEILYFDGRWNAIFAGKRLSTHHCPIQAAEKVSKARTTAGAEDLHLASLNIPNDLSRWKRTVIPIPRQDQIMIQAPRLFV